MADAMQQALDAVARAGLEAGMQIVDDRRRAVRVQAEHYLPHLHWWRIMPHIEVPDSRQYRIVLLRKAIGTERRYVRRYPEEGVNRLIALRGAYIAERLAALRDRAQAKKAA